MTAIADIFQTLFFCSHYTKMKEKGEKNVYADIHHLHKHLFSLHTNVGLALEYAEMHNGDEIARDITTVQDKCNGKRKTYSCTRTCKYNLTVMKTPNGCWRISSYSKHCNSCSCRKKSHSSALVSTEFILVVFYIKTNRRRTSVHSITRVFLIMQALEKSPGIK